MLPHRPLADIHGDLLGDNAFLNFHGENCARLSCEQTVHGWAYAPSMLMVVLAPLLFLEPVTQVRELHKIFTDHTVRTSRWNAFSLKLKGQLQDSNLLASLHFHYCALVCD